MIIFLLLIFCFLIIKFKIKIYISVNGTKSEVKVNFLFFEFKRKGKFLLKPKGRVVTKRKVPVKSKTMGIERIRKKINFGGKGVRCSTVQRMGIAVLKGIRVERLEIDEEIGALEPNITAVALPLVSLVTTIPLSFFNINYDNFKYRVIPAYMDLRFKFVLKTEITFRLFRVILAIFNAILHK